MRLEGLHRASITESPLCGISVATQLPHNPRLKLLRFSERRLSWRITAIPDKWVTGSFSERARTIWLHRCNLDRRVLWLGLRQQRRDSHQAGEQNQLVHAVSSHGNIQRRAVRAEASQ